MASFGCSPGEDGWDSLELALRTPWFLVDIDQSEQADDDSFSIRRTMMFSSFAGVERLLEHIGHDSCQKLQSVHIVRPSDANGQSLWEMNQVLMVWNTRNGPDRSHVQVFETLDGQKLVEHGLTTEISELKFESVAYKFKH